MQPESHTPESTTPTSSPLDPRLTRRTLLVLGWLALLFGVYLLVFLVPDVVRTAGGPESMTLAEAAATADSDQTYARLTDGAWDCDTITHVRTYSSSQRRLKVSHTEVFLTDGRAPAQHVVFVTFSGEKDCSDLETVHPDGYLKRMSSGTQQELTNEARLARYYDATDLMELCAYCGQENSLIGTVFGFVMTGMGVVMLAFGYRIKVPPSTDEAKDTTDA